VYHVLTAPFDSERLSALTRSRSYHRLAENLLERSRADPAIVIPTENREWWERTAMAGQHRPTEEPGAANPTAGDQSSGFPLWPIWIVLMLLLKFALTCNSESTSRTYTSEQAKRYLALVPPTSPNESPEAPSSNRAVFRRLVFCDSKTRMELIRHMNRALESDAKTDAPRDANPDVRVLVNQMRLDESDPEVAALLAKCKPRQ
jgi:hypothetical protein